MAQTRGKTGETCKISGIYVSGCCEKLVPFALDQVFSMCCEGDTAWSFLEVVQRATKGSKPNGAGKGRGWRGVS
jgi:hypothetical protein